MNFKRFLDLQSVKGSAFLFGPRMTGKTFLLRKLNPELYVDLLDPEVELELSRSPGLFREQLAALKRRRSLVVIDEIQRVPALLDYVQMGIESRGHRFILSGSSARKLKRGGANLLGGRAVDLRLHPLTAKEIGARFRIRSALQYGTIPKMVQLQLAHQSVELKRLLRSYYTTYIKEEIQAEAATRNVGAFQRFLDVAAQDNAQVLEFSNVSRECSVPASTVKEYYSILEDTLLGEFLWPWDRSERKKARPKFYFFDCGVIRAIQNRLNDPPTPAETGFLFETWFVREITRYRDYDEKEDMLSFWREGQHEIDLIISTSRGPTLAVECKSGKQLLSTATVRTFRARFPKVPLVVASLIDTEERELGSGVRVLPWDRAIELYRSL